MASHHHWDQVLNSQLDRCTFLSHRTLLPSSMFNVWLVSEPGTIKNLVPSPALKPILAPAPHWMSPYMKNTNVICWSAAITTWNVFTCNNNLLSHKHQLLQHTGNETFTNYYHSTAHDTALHITVSCYSDITCVDVYLRSPLDSATLSHVPINSVVGVKLQRMETTPAVDHELLEKGGIRCLPEEYVSNVHIVPERSNQWKAIQWKALRSQFKKPGLKWNNSISLTCKTEPLKESNPVTFNYKYWTGMPLWFHCKNQLIWNNHN